MESTSHSSVKFGTLFQSPAQVLANLETALPYHCCHPRWLGQCAESQHQVHEMPFSALVM